MNNESDNIKSSNPLRILTIDGGGLQAISILLILNKVLENFAKQEVHKKPKPCELFDIIAGIGTGGWLAILLGRFRMDITACLTEWYKLVKCNTPKSRSEELRLRIFHHGDFDTDRLMEQVDRLTQVYGTGDYLFEDEPKGARTRHVFVAALKPKVKGYNLFRIYDIPSLAKLLAKFLKGPENPSTVKISHAFREIGTVRYSTPERKEQTSSCGKIRFWDPKQHDITQLALDEVLGIYGVDVPLSVVLNIGPGLRGNVDPKQMVRRSSWSSNALAADSALPSTPNSSQIEDKHQRSQPLVNPDESEQGSKEPSFRVHDSVSRRASASTHAAEGEHEPAETRTNPFGSIRNKGTDTKTKRLEDDIEADIRKKLQSIYSDGSGIYFRLAPTNAP